MKKLQLASLTLAALLLAGCGASAASTAESTSEAVSTEETAPAATAAPAETQAPAAALPDGVYTAKFNTDSSMFHANEAVDGMGTLTVENGTMTSTSVCSPRRSSTCIRAWPPTPPPTRATGCNLPLTR